MILTKRTKRCPKCEEIKPKSDFHKDKSKKDGLVSSCKPCHKATNKAWNQANKEKYKARQKEYYQANKEKYKAYSEANKEKIEEYRLNNKFGITQDEYDLNLELQDHACKICKVDASEFTKKLHVDHCHTTGELRGLLCPSCNVGLGHFRDDIELLEDAIDYVKNSKFFKLP